MSLTFSFPTLHLPLLSTVLHSRCQTAAALGPIINSTHIVCSQNSVPSNQKSSQNVNDKETIFEGGGECELQPAYLFHSFQTFINAGRFFQI